MTKKAEKLRVITVERIDGDVLLRFSNATSILYHAQFLWDVREQDGNIAVPDAAAEEDDAPLALPA